MAHGADLIASVGACDSVTELAAAETFHRAHQAVDRTDDTAADEEDGEADDRQGGEAERRQGHACGAAGQVARFGGLPFLQRDQLFAVEADRGADHLVDRRTTGLVHHRGDLGVLFDGGRLVGLADDLAALAGAQLAEPIRDRGDVGSVLGQELLGRDHLLVEAVGSLFAGLLRRGVVLIRRSNDVAVDRGLECGKVTIGTCQIGRRRSRPCDDAVLDLANHGHLCRGVEQAGKTDARQQQQ